MDLHSHPMINDPPAMGLLLQGLPRQNLQQPQSNKHAKEDWDNVKCLCMSETWISQPHHSSDLSHLKASEHSMQMTLKKQERNTSIVDPLAMLLTQICTYSFITPLTPRPQPTAHFTNQQSAQTSPTQETHATVHDGHIVTEPIRGKAPGHVARSGKTKRKMDFSTSKIKPLLMGAKRERRCVDVKLKAFLADVDVDEAPMMLSLFMANLSSIVQHQTVKSMRSGYMAKSASNCLYDADTFCIHLTIPLCIWDSEEVVVTQQNSRESAKTGYDELGQKANTQLKSKGRTVADSIAERLTRPTAYKFKTDCSIIPVWNQIELAKPFNDIYITPAHTLKVFSNMSRKGVKFSGKVTPLFDSILVPHQAPEGEGGPTSDRAKGDMTLEELSVLWTNLSNRDLCFWTPHKYAQGRKNAKPGPTLDDSMFDNLDADHGMDYMDTEEPVNEGRLSKETEELNVTHDTQVLEKGGSNEEPISTAGNTGVSTAVLEVNTATPMTPPTTTSVFEDEDIFLADALHLPSIDPKDKGKAKLDASEELAARLQMKEREMYKVEERSRLLAEYFENRKKQLATERSAAIRNKPRQQNSTEKPNVNYLNHTSRYKHAQLNKKTLEEIQAPIHKTKKELHTLGLLGLRRMKERIEEDEIRSTGVDEEELMEVQDISRLSLKWFQGLCLRQNERIMIIGRTKEWILKSWNFYNNCGVHILVLEDETKFFMLAERRYPLTKETLKRMLALRLIAEFESKVVFDLLRFIQKQIDESGIHDGSEKNL
ncbi:hypothetical protein Tco_1254544 [Tanacetum coccineum]